MTDTSERDSDLLDALLAAAEPSELDPELNEALIARALGETHRVDETPANAPNRRCCPIVEPMPTEDEHRAADALRRALDGETVASGDWDLVLALRAAHAPTALDHDALLQAIALTEKTADALDHGPRTSASSPRRSHVLAIVASLAVAAAGVLVLRNASVSRMELGARHDAPQANALRRTAAVLTPDQPEQPAMALSRSTAPLFREPFETSQTTTRIDRIVALRGREMRQNRYLAWRVE